jgi:hypothetical protein
LEINYILYLANFWRKSAREQFQGTSSQLKGEGRAPMEASSQILSGYEIMEIPL